MCLLCYNIASAKTVKGNSEKISYKNYCNKEAKVVKFYKDSEYLRGNNPFSY